jgi:small-conductance mechanosensitive channel
VRDLWQQPWLAWTIGIAIGLPLVSVILTELHNGLSRRQSKMARAVAMLRNFVIPTLALLLLLTQAAGIQFHVTGVRLVSTVFALLTLMLVLSSVNVLLFGQADRGSWRQRLPSIFIDIGRVVIVAVCLAILLSQVWGAHIGALFTALGVGSLVIGLALQNAVGSVVSGLLLLFEQPFTLGDYLDVSPAKGQGVEGRVVEVNWRAVHIDTGNAIQIIPDSALATSSFANLSRPTMAIDETVLLKFAVDDAPLQVCTLLERVAADLPLLAVGSRPRASLLGSGSYELVVSLQNVADVGMARSQLLSWLWYASRRENLHLDGADPKGWTTDEEIGKAARSVGAALFLSPDEAAQMASQFELSRYGAGETVQRIGLRPATLGIVVDGQLELRRQLVLGGYSPVGTIERNGYVHPSALTREAVTLVAVSLRETVILNISVDTIQELVARQPSLAHDLSDEIDRRRELATSGSAHLSHAHDDDRAAIGTAG